MPNESTVPMPPFLVPPRRATGGAASATLSPFAVRLQRHGHPLGRRRKQRVHPHASGASTPERGGGRGGRWDSERKRVVVVVARVRVRVRVRLRCGYGHIYQIIAGLIGGMALWVWVWVWVWVWMLGGAGLDN